MAETPDAPETPDACEGSFPARELVRQVQAGINGLGKLSGAFRFLSDPAVAADHPEAQAAAAKVLAGVESLSAVMIEFFRTLKVSTGAD